MSLVENEQTKLTATAVSNLGLALMVAGFVAPLASVSFSLASAPSASILTVVVSFSWLGAGLTLHLSARRYLKQLRT